MKEVKLVLTGGPCAGKTTLSLLLAQAYQHSLINVPEAASLLFSGGFPRFPSPSSLRATQRAIYHTQLSLEDTFRAQYPNRVLLLDRATVDGAAYWPEGPADYFSSLGTSLAEQLSRYDSVLYLESAAQADYDLHKEKNPSRTENWEEAQRLDRETFLLWSQHPNFVHVRNNRSFEHKVAEVLAAVAGHLQAS